jgi:O-acetyl-ADP-ribose deacetylase (regulator of RNase III)
MRRLDNESDVEVVFDAKSMTYRVSGNPFQIEWASKFLTDAWNKQQESQRLENGATNRLTAKKGSKQSETESRRSPILVTSEDSDSSDVEISYSPLDSPIKSTPNDIVMGQQSSPPFNHSSMISKKTKKSDNFGRNTSPNRFSRSEMFHQTPNVKFNPQILEHMNSPLNLPDCRVSIDDPRSRSPPTVQKDKIVASMTRPKKQTLPKRQNLTDVEKYSLPRTIPKPSVTAAPQKKTPQVFNNYESDSDEESAVITRPGPELPSIRDSVLQQPPSNKPSASFPRVKRPVQIGMSLSQSDFPDLALEHETFIGNVHVRLIIGDILTQKTDAIISPANTDLSSLYGISAVIARNADRNMRKECADYVAKHGHLLFGDVIHTCAGGNLDPKVTYILHAAIPLWREDNPEQSSHLLTCAYLNCFQYADKIWLRSLSMPIMGAGKTTVCFVLIVCLGKCWAEKVGEIEKLKGGGVRGE